MSNKTFGLENKMPLYSIVDQKFIPLKQQPISKERDLQRLVESNLLELFDIHFLETEYSTTSGGRIDTLGVDRNGAPVIIEYKRKQNDHVINQALSYRKWLTAQKPELFEMLIRKHLSEDIVIDMELDLKNPRIICIAETFNRFDIDTADVLLPVFRVELMTYRVYENGIFYLEPLQLVSERQAGSVASASKTLNEADGRGNIPLSIIAREGRPKYKLSLTTSGQESWPWDHRSRNVRFDLTSATGHRKILRRSTYRDLHF
jgi:hypothetical protein